MNKLTTDQFISRSIEVHGSKYVYSESVYVHSLKKLKVICPKHGEFNIKPSNHINNKQGCPICGNESTGSKQKKQLKDLLEQLEKKANSCNYDFSEIDEFKNNRAKVRVRCKEHGFFDRSIRDVIRSKYFGCRKCKIADDTFTTDAFALKSSKVHEGKYSYEKAIYVKSHEPVTVTCPKHGDFSISPYVHIAGGGFCPKCTKYVSSYEIELEQYIRSEIKDVNLETSCRKIKGTKEIDLICPGKKLAIEFDGLYWHSSLFKDRKYHLKKTNLMSDLGIRLIHIFEDEWLGKKDICKSMILNALSASKEKIHARKCLLKKISSKESREFFEENHIQGNCHASHRYGLYYFGRLVAAMTFGKRRICVGSKSKKSEFELLRFCCLKFTSVVGGASKLFKAFMENNPEKITTYCDKRWGSGKIYEILGFKRLKDTPPNYFYVRGNKRHGRFGFRKDVLVKQGHDGQKTELQIMQELGYNRIYDCGSMKFEWTKKEEK